MLSYKEIININKAFADAHHVIQNFEVGEVWQLTNHDEFESFKYPLMFMERQPASYSKGEFIYTFRIWFLTRVESPKDRGSSLLFSEYTNAISSMTNCAQNLISYWLQDTNYADLEIDLAGSIEPETDVTPDKISGVSIIVNFRVNFSYDNCLIPMTGVPAPDSDDVVVTINDAAFETYLPGTTNHITVKDTNGTEVGSKTATNEWTVPAAGGSFDYDIHLNSVDTGQNVTVDGTNITLNLGDY